MHKPTPGPWRTKRGTDQKMCDEGTTVASVVGDDSEFSLWWIFSDAETHGDSEADARLIAAAPAMYEALEAALPELLRVSPSFATPKVRTALAIARGESGEQP